MDPSVFQGSNLEMEDENLYFCTYKGYWTLSSRIIMRNHGIINTDAGTTELITTAQQRGLP